MWKIIIYLFYFDNVNLLIKWMKTFVSVLGGLTVLAMIFYNFASFRNRDNRKLIKMGELGNFYRQDKLRQ